MVREIKFRAWDDIKEKMIYHVSLDLKTGWWVYFGSSSGTVFDEGLIKVGAKKGTPPIMQLTGLKDEEGRDIYEGDIVEFEPFNPDHCEGDCLPQQRIEVSLYFYRVWLKNEKFGHEGEFLLDPYYCRIIGNIHDNPELMEMTR